MLWNFFASVKLTIALLLIIAVISIIGTLIPMGSFDIYHSFGFQILILMLGINIVICSMERFSQTLKIISIKTPSTNISRFYNSEAKETITIEEPIEKLKRFIAREVEKGFKNNVTDDTNDKFLIFAEKGRLTRMSVYIIHISILILLLGSLVGSILGFTGYVNIPEGSEVRNIDLNKSGHVYNLGFAVKCDDFDVSFYDSGTPKEYLSKLTILIDNKPVLKQDIVVNKPLRYKGISFYQSSYGLIPPKEALLNFNSKETGMSYKINVKVDEEIDIPEKKGKFKLGGLSHYEEVGEAFFGTYSTEKGKEEVVIPLKFPTFDKMRGGDFFISLLDFNKTYYTGLQVVYDPGVSLVYAGFIIMIIGFFINFFMSHQSLCIEITKIDEKTSSVMVSGIANKNKIGMQNKVKELSLYLKEKNYNE
ncbi:MAG: cytochrome c biogenesis protein ResB [Desulfobacterales bacterium]|nr:cytochrome c biogenesis protein ResB [Desulfobacterales bacterium]